VQQNHPSGLQAELAGSAATDADLAAAFQGINTTILLVTIAVVAFILLLTYRSPILWLIPLLCVGVASQFGSGVVYGLAKGAGLTVNGQSLFFLTVLAFGVGTDYSLLLIARYREELRRHRDRHEAMAFALRRTTPTILASAVAVGVALLCLLVAEMNNTRGLGPVAAIGVVGAFLAIASLLPALLVVLGRWVFWPFVPQYTGEIARVEARDHRFWGSIARWVGGRPRPLWIGSLVALVALGFGVTTLSTSLTGNDTFTKTVDSVVGQQLIAAHFPAGSSAPVDVYARASTARRVEAVVRETPGVVGITGVQTNGGWVHVTATLESPPESPTARDTVTAMRRTLDGVGGAQALVGGPTAVTIDTAAANGHDDSVIIPLVLLVVFVVLVVLLRALVAPLVLLVSAALSFAGALGLSALLFQVLGYPRIDPSLPLSAFIFLVALGVDYTIFLMSRAREEVAREGHSAGLLHALMVTGGVITSAGIVLAATFSVGVLIPVVSFLHLSLVIALGVLLDTFVVRTLLVPSPALDIGPRMWWPSSLVWLSMTAMQERHEHFGATAAAQGESRG
jgi:putative drug exporter of the RND superfamily